MKYLNGTLDMLLILEANDSNNLHWWIDGALTNHNDMHSHTGRALSLRKEMVYGTSTHQKLNTCGLTEAELVVVDSCMGWVLWMK